MIVLSNSIVKDMDVNKTKDALLAVSELHLFIFKHVNNYVLHKQQ